MLERLWSFGSIAVVDQGFGEQKLAANGKQGDPKSTKLLLTSSPTSLVRRCKIRKIARKIVWGGVKLESLIPDE